MTTHENLFTGAALRREAVERLRQRRPDLAAMGSQDMQTLIHELEVHQAELEVQNEELRRTEQALGQAHDRYRELYDHAPVGYLTLDPQGKLCQVNLAGALLCGRERERLIGRRFEVVLHPADRDAAYLMLRQTAAAGAQTARELRLRRPDGEVRWMRVEVAPRQEGMDAEAGGFRLTLSDVTERRQQEEALRESEERLRILVEGTTQAVWEADAQGGRVAAAASQSWQECTGQSPEQAAGLGWLEAVHPDERVEAERLWRRAVAAGAPLSTDFRLRQADGDWCWSNLRATPLRGADGSVRRWLAMNLDISDRVRADKAQEQDRRKNEFLAMLGHELRNPLAAIWSALEVQRLMEPADATAAEVRAMLERQMVHLIRLVDDLLDISRVTRGKIELRRERVDLAAVVQEVVAANRPLIDVSQRRLSLSLSAQPLVVDADPVRLSQVLTNLLTNAAKFTRDDGEIRIRIGIEGDRAMVAVEDDGIGIAPDMLPRIFELFTQAANPRQPLRGGLGIGLALVRSLVELHGGTVEARSEGQDRGSEIIVRLPLAAGEIAAAEPVPAPGQRALAAHRLLVVQDNHDAADGIAFLLRLLRAQVEVAYDGPSALRLCETYQPTEILMDLGMPDMDGYETAARLYNRFPDKPFRLIALSGWGQEEHRDRAQAAGFDTHLTKPVDIEELKALLTG